MLLTLVLLGWLAMRQWPATPIARSLRRWTVERPAAWLNRITRGHVLLVVIVISIVMTAMWLQGDAPRLLAFAAPDLIGWAAMFDLSAVLDAAVAAALIAGNIKLGTVRSTLMPRRPKPRQARRRSAISRKKPAANDEDGRAFRLAA